MSEAPEIFLSEEHEYTVEGIVRVSVTQVLQDLGFIDFSQVHPIQLEKAQKRGSAVHACCHYLEEGDLDWSTVSPEIWPYVEAFAMMKEETGWKAELREQMVFHPLFNYCGQLDGFGSMSKLGIEKVLPDYKSGVPQRAAKYQTAGYALAIGEPYVPRCSIHLKATGKYKIHWHKDFNNVDEWKSIVRTYHLKHQED